MARASIAAVTAMRRSVDRPASLRFYSTPIGSSYLVLLTLPLRADACGAVREGRSTAPTCTCVL
jgi:hypothetical protein